MYKSLFERVSKISPVGSPVKGLGGGIHPAKTSPCFLKDPAYLTTLVVGLQYRPRPHLRPDQNFSTDLQNICKRAEQDLLQLMIQQQEKNVNADTEAINALKQTQTISQTRSTKRKTLRNQYKNKLRTTNEKFIKNMCNKNLTDQEIALLAKDLKFIPTPKKSASQKKSH